MTTRRPDFDDAPPAALVLAGGASSRMGSPKSALDWHGAPLLRRVCGVCRRLGGPVAVVRQPGQPLPTLPDWVEIIDDPTPGVGPLMGVAAGLTQVAGRCPTAVVTATDHPFLHPAVLRVLRSRLGDGTVDVAVPVVDGHRQVMVSAWRTGLAERVAADVTAGFRGPNQVLARYRVADVASDDLTRYPEVAAADPGLHSLEGLNTPAAYGAALRRPLPVVTVTQADGHTQQVQAAWSGTATAGRAADEYEWLLADRAGQSIPLDPDGHTPLLDGDVLAAR